MFVFPDWLIPECQAATPEDQDQAAGSDTLTTIGRPCVPTRANAEEAQHTPNNQTKATGAQEVTHRETDQGAHAVV